MGSIVEIFLNFAWAALAVTLVALWLHTGSRMGYSRYSQIVAIAVLIAILFPVISVSDDLMAVQNPAETDNCQRRDHLAPGDAHPLPLAAATEPSSILAGLTFCFLQYVSPKKVAPRAVDHPVLIPIANRPPPAA